MTGSVNSIRRTQLRELDTCARRPPPVSSCTCGRSRLEMAASLASFVSTSRRLSLHGVDLPMDLSAAVGDPAVGQLLVLEHDELADRALAAS